MLQCRDIGIQLNIRAGKLTVPTNEKQKNAHRDPPYILGNTITNKVYLYLHNITIWCKESIGRRIHIKGVSCSLVG